MERQIDETTARLIAGTMKTMEAIVTVLLEPKSIDRQKLEALVEHLLGELEDTDAEGVPLALMLRFLRPSEPPRPVLRLIPGGKR